MPLDVVTLEGALVRLIPLSRDHVDALCAVGLEPDIWRWIPRRVDDRAGMRAFVEECLEGWRAGTALPFTTTLRETGQVVGATRFMSIALAHKRLEIGGTWLGSEWQRTRVNTEAKYLMLRHAFETWGCQRVEFKTHAGNVRSRRAILRLGAVEEGTFRKHMVQEDGSSRDSVYFSIVDDEWPAVKETLEERLATRID
ncbi:MAG: GNAT family protein [Gemmatimonadaceae bacterium]